VPGSFEVSRGSSSQGRPIYRRIGRSAPILVFMCVALVLSACGDEAGPPSTSPGTTADGTDGVSPSPTRSYTADTFPEGTIPDLLATDGRFITILRILDLHDSTMLSFLTISHETSTFFAPTDDAFADLPDGTVDALLVITNNPAAREVLAAHVLPYVLRSGEFETGPLGMGDDRDPVLQVTVQGDAVTIDGADVIEDLEAVNGVVHVVDGVLGIDRIELELEGVE
jgi:uncharacterized surface protein with fasciclin (FAS1) repeats